MCLFVCVCVFVCITVLDSINTLSASAWIINKPVRIVLFGGVGVCLCVCV